MGKKWQTLLADSIRDAEGIKAVLGLTDQETESMAEIIERYPICVNSYYLGLIDKNDPDDPVRKMCIPDIYESSEGGTADTSGESDNTVIQGLQHKYRQTALMLSTNQCAMYCRHCFRKRMVGSSSDEIAQHLPAMAEYIREHKEINNVLISGGDSFMNSSSTIEKYLKEFTEIPALDFIRFGTRIPVVLPQRITEDEELLSILKEYGEKKQILIITHFNHPKELTEEAVEAVRAMQKAGCVVRNQTVLLKGVNDDPDVLAVLMNKLVSFGVIPYYIFQCRPVEGVKNQFQVPLLQGVDIVQNARKKINGQAKSFHFAFSHPSGKIEIVGKLDDDQIVFKYHQAKNDNDNGRVFIRKISDEQCWLDEI